MNITLSEKKSKMVSFLENLAIWLVAFSISTAILVLVNLAPPEIKEVGKYVFHSVSLNDGGTAVLGNLNFQASTSAASVGITNTNSVPIEISATAINPIRVIIKKIGVDSRVLSPNNPDNKILDESLLKGVVHYPGSGTLEDNFNIFLFGHSSYLPAVNNQSFKAFNRLQELQLGDEIQLFSDKRRYFYKVTKMEAVDENEALINFASGKKKLILSTCDSFGKKTGRFVVEAVFVSSYPIN